MDITNLSYDSRRNGHFLQITQSGNSNAIEMPSKFDKLTTLISSISGGSVNIQYSLSTRSRVLDDTAVWHSWSKGTVSSVTGTVFDSPITYLKVVSASSVTYTLEVLT